MSAVFSPQCVPDTETLKARIQSLESIVETMRARLGDAEVHAAGLNRAWQKKHEECERVRATAERGDALRIEFETAMVARCARIAALEAECAELRRLLEIGCAASRCGTCGRLGTYASTTSIDVFCTSCKPRDDVVEMPDAADVRKIDAVLRREL